MKKTPVKKSAVKKTAVKKTGSADSERADRADRATKPTARGGKNPADARRATANKAANAGGTRKSGRSRNAAEPSRFRSLDLTGNVRMLTDQDIADPAPGDFEPSTADAHAHESAEPTQEAPFGVQATETATPSWSDAAPSWSSWSASAPQTPPFSPAELPISGYDELSLPSLRARLRNLGAAELAELLAHERSHANRDDVITMFERRIAKLAEADD